MPTKKILYIEDNPNSRLLIRKILEREGFDVYEAEDGVRGIDEAKVVRPDLILVDLDIPELDGFATATRLKGFPQFRKTPIVAITGHATEGIRERALAAGCDGFLTKPVFSREFSGRISGFLNGEKEALESWAGSGHLQEYSRHLVDQLADTRQEVHEQGQRVENLCNGIIWSLTNALDQKDPYTAGHSARVTQLALAIARRMGLSSEDLMTVARGAQLHDVGKVVIDLSFINKPEQLSEREWALMKKHPSIGASILTPLCFLNREIQIVAHHHERWDGRGYPDGLAGEELDLLACIVTAADSFDAMTSGRCYRPETLGLDKVAQEFERCRGKQFHPDVADIVVRLIKKNEVPCRANAMATSSLAVIA